LIKQISYSNIKGQTATQDLTGLDLFIGPNGSGKTTRLQSLGLSQLGYIPGQGKKASDTFKVATGEEMSSGCKLGNGFEFTRTFARKVSRERKTGKESVKISESLTVSPGQGEKNDTQKKARVMAEMGNFAVALDFNEFLDLSDAKRRDFIYSLSPFDSASWTKEMVRIHLENELLIPELEENNPEQYQIYQELIQDVMSKYPGNYDIHQGLQAMIDYTSDRKSHWESKKKDSQGAVRSIADAKNQMKETDRGIAENKKELDELQNQLIKVEKQISRDTELRKINENRAQRIIELGQQIDQIWSTPNASVEPINKKVTEIDQEIASLKSQEIKKIDVTSELAAVKEKKASLKQKADIISTSINESQEKVADIISQERNIHFTSKSLDEALAKTGGVDGKCVIHGLIACPKDFTGFDSYVEDKKTELNDELEALSASKKGILGQLKILEEKHDTFTVEIEQLEAEMETIYNKAEDTNRAIEERDTKINTLEKAKDDLIRQHEKKLEEVKTAQERRQNQIQLLKEEQDKLKNQPPEAIGDTSIMEKQATGIREQIKTLKEAVQEKEKAKQTILLLQQSMLDNRTSEYKADGFKAISKALGPSGVQGELVKEILEPLRQDIQSNLELMGFDNPPYFDLQSDTGQEIFQFGWVNQKRHKVNFDVLSAGEKVVFLAAIMATIIERANPKIKILAIDDINHLDKKNLQLALDGISKIRDKMDNIILGGAVQSEFDAGEWKVWDLGAAEGVAKSA